MNTLELFRDLVPYSSYNAENSKIVASGEGNFMWHGMTSYQWYHQTMSDIENTIRELGNLLKSKEKMIQAIDAMIGGFDWSHMYSDDSKPTKAQAERDKLFNECIALCPEDIREYAYKEFIRQYLKFSPNGKNPMSYDQFMAGVKV